MTEYTIRPFEIQDLDNFEGNEFYDAEKTRAAAMEDVYARFTIVIEGNIAGFLFFTQVRPRELAGFFAVSKDVTAREAGVFVDTLNYVKERYDVVQMWTVSKEKEGHDRWHEFLGFSKSPGLITVENNLCSLWGRAWV